MLQPMTGVGRERNGGFETRECDKQTFVLVGCRQPFAIPSKDAPTISNGTRCGRRRRLS